MSLNITKQNGGESPPFAVSLKDICKRFGPVRANDSISLDVLSGTIHGIIGENGAGKSTLMSILYGFYQPDSGQIELDGISSAFRQPSEAIAMGIGMVHQHFVLVPNFTALENIILGAEGQKGLKTGLQLAREKLQELSQTYGLEVELDSITEELPVGIQQRIEILKALYRGARVLILDEPTGVLTPQETDQLFEILKALKSEGVTILLITHKLHEVMAITDVVSVMRQGKLVAHTKTNETSPEWLAEQMVGRSVLVNSKFALGKPDKIALSAHNLCVSDKRGFNSLKSASFELREGEIMGVAGIAGNGQSELLSVLSGIIKPAIGAFAIGENLFNSSQPADPAFLRQLGIAHVPEDRHAEGLILQFQAFESSVLGYETNPKLGRNLLTDPNIIKEHCSELMNSFDVRPPNPKLLSSQFSGGNQQKLVLAREISSMPKVLLVGQPTRGVDIGAIEFIHNTLIKMRDRGCAILLVSVELEEILSLSDRIMVMNAGEVVGTVDKLDATKSMLGKMMAGIATGAASASPELTSPELTSPNLKGGA